MAFIEARSLPSPVDLRDLIDPLYPEYQNIMRHMLLVYSSSNPETMTGKAIAGLQKRAKSSSTQTFHSERDVDKWKKSMYTYVSYLASPRVGRDRLAIALSYFRDYVLTGSVEDLMEACFQLSILGTMLGK